MVSISGRRPAWRPGGQLGVGVRRAHVGEPRRPTMFPLLAQGVDMATHSPRSFPAVRAGIYTRISYDPAGQRAGVERQRLDCEGLCRSRGWEVARDLEDNDRSAYSGKPRIAYQQLLRAVEDR